MSHEFKAALFIAALSHAEKAPQSSERRAYALYYVECVYRDLRKRRMFTLAFAAQDLRGEMQAADKIHRLKAKYAPNRQLGAAQDRKPERFAQKDGEAAPGGNTGATPVQLKILEDYI